jgi:hypothetical protein
MSTKVAQVIVDVLNDAGVKNCYRIVGNTLSAAVTAGVLWSFHSPGVP